MPKKCLWEFNLARNQEIKKKKWGMTFPLSDCKDGTHGGMCSACACLFSSVAECVASVENHLASLSPICPLWDLGPVPNALLTVSYTVERMPFSPRGIKWKIPQEACSICSLHINIHSGAENFRRAVWFSAVKIPPKFHFQELSPRGEGIRLIVPEASGKPLPVEGWLSGLCWCLQMQVA